jgi:phosphohistidine phosphatase
MKTLYLVRHAKSSWKYPSLDDFERPLNKRGRKSAPFMGEILKKLKVTPNLVISSPANRAAMTARIIAAAINYPLENIVYSEAIYEFSEDALIHVINKIDDSVNSSMVVGHNPAINGIPTCGVCCLDLDIPSWAKIGKNCGKISFFEYPKKHTQ